MTTDEFDRMDRFAVQLEELLEKAMEADQFKEIARQMKVVMADVDPKIALQVKVKIELIHEERENALRLSSMGYEAWGGGESAPEPSKVEPLFEGATVHKYSMRGKIYKAPHDQCPNCWAPWLDKMKNRHCFYCNMEMGKDLKQMLDNGICPHCEKGRVSFDLPTCAVCGRTVDSNLVSWG